MIIVAALCFVLAAVMVIHGFDLADGSYKGNTRCQCWVFTAMIVMCLGIIAATCQPKATSKSNPSELPKFGPGRVCPA